MCEPLGLEYVAAAAMRDGWSCGVLWEPDPDLALEEIVRGEPSVVCFSVYSSGARSARQLRSRIRRVLPRTRFVFGGPHPSAALDLLDGRGDTVVVAGEGEEVISEVLSAMASGGMPEEKCGVYSERGEARLIRPARPPSWGRIPWPLRSKEILRRAGIRTLSPGSPEDAHGMATVCAMRGCANDCFYCGMSVVHGPGVRIRDYSDFAEELRYLHDSLSIRQYFLVDAYVNASARHLRGVADAFAAVCPDSTWSGHFSLRSATEDSVRRLAESGCRKLLVGIESLDDGVLRGLQGRPFLGRSDMFERLQWIDAHGVLSRAFLMVGLPGDTPRSLAENLRHVEQLPVDELHVTYYTPTPGTAAFDDPSVRWLRPDRRYDGITLHQPALKPLHMSVEQLVNARTAMLRRFYGSPLYRRRIEAKAQRFPTLALPIRRFQSLVRRWGYA